MVKAPGRDILSDGEDNGILPDCDGSSAEGGVNDESTHTLEVRLGVRTCWQLLLLRPERYSRGSVETLGFFPKDITGRESLQAVREDGERGDAEDGNEEEEKGGNLVESEEEEHEEDEGEAKV